MNPELLERLHLVCPVCRKPGKEPGAVELHEVHEQDGPHTIRGLLRCTHPECRSLYPIVDGIPIVVCDLAGWWESQGPSVRAGTDAEDGLEKLFASLDRTASLRQDDGGSVNVYLDAHYNLPDYTEVPDWLVGPRNAYWQTVRSLIDAQNGPRRKSLDLGCSTGRLTFEMARDSELAVGIDIQFAAVRHAAALQRNGKTAFRRKTGGGRFEPVVVKVQPAGNVFFMVADALAPPFEAYGFDRVVALNLLDNVTYPTVLLGQMDALLKKDGEMILASPYEWRQEITGPGEWLVDQGMASAGVVRAILEDRWGPGLGFNYKIAREVARLPWVLRQHDRHWTLFLVHLIQAVKQKMAGE